jgi:hypothetical protein
MVRCAIAAAGLAAFSGAALGQTTTTETFENGSNAAGWTTYGPNESVTSPGGNPGWYLQSTGLDTFAVRLDSGDGLNSAFTGNYAARNVTALGLDAIVTHVDFSAAGRPMTLVLCNNMGTPGDVGDDLCVYVRGGTIPQPGQGWQHYSLAVPSQSTTLPQDWQVMVFGQTNLTDDQIWDLVIHDVDYVEWFWADPEFFYIFQMWDVGADNLFITEGAAACYANCDGSTIAPVLNVLDFNCFLNRFSTGDSYANCDGSTAAPVLNVLDFNCFLNRFAAGCP